MVMGRVIVCVRARQGEAQRWAGLYMGLAGLLEIKRLQLEEHESAGATRKTQDAGLTLQSSGQAARRYETGLTLMRRPHSCAAVAI
jgi:hypothetical protein